MLQLLLVLILEDQMNVSFLYINVWDDISRFFHL